MSTRLAMICTYPPRRCGVAAYAWPLRERLRRARPDWRVDVVAIEVGEPMRYGPEVGAAVGLRDNCDAVPDVLGAIAARGSQLLILHYEPGLWPAAQLCRLLERCPVPVVTVLHNVATAADLPGRALLHYLGARSARLVAPIQAVRTLLVDRCAVAADRVCVIPWPHNGPEAGRPISRRDARRRLGCSGRQVLFTYGFLSPGKGIDLAIDSVAALRERFPMVLYWVVGDVHFRVPDRAAFLAGLSELVALRRLEDHVRIRPEHARYEELDLHLAAADLYVCPHLVPGSVDQTSSGTIPHALRRGRPFVSIANLYAEDVARQGCGVVTAPTSQALADAVARLLSEPAERSRMERRARQAGRRLSWDHVAGAYVALIEEVLRT